MQRLYEVNMSAKFQNKYRIKSARLEGYDYRNEGLYFVTICTKDREHFFGKCENEIMNLNGIGLTAEKYWMEIPNHFPNVSLDEFVVMPNHLHGIICINKKIITELSSVETLHATSENNGNENNETLHATSLHSTNKNLHFKDISPKPASLATIMRSYKSSVTNEIHKLNLKYAWQSRFHDHIIRNEISYRNIQNYILNNPKNWKDDEFFDG